MKNSIVVLCFLFGLILSQALHAQFPELVLRQGDEVMMLEEVMSEEQNYILNLYESWCGWCKVELRDWSSCEGDFGEHYDTKVIVLCGDGFNDQEEATEYFKNQEIPFELYFAEPSALRHVFPFSGLPTNYFFQVENDQAVYIDKRTGYKNCETIHEILAELFDITLSSININDIKNDGIADVQFLDQQLIISPLMNDHSYGVTIYDLQGRLVDHRENNRGVYSKEFISSGGNILIVNLFQGSRMQTKKVYVK